MISLVNGDSELMRRDSIARKNMRRKAELRYEDVEGILKTDVGQPAKPDRGEQAPPTFRAASLGRNPIITCKEHLSINFIIMLKEMFRLVYKMGSRRSMATSHATYTSEQIQSVHDSMCRYFIVGNIGTSVNRRCHRRSRSRYPCVGAE